MSNTARTLAKVALVAVGVVMPGGFALMLYGLRLLGRSATSGGPERRIASAHWHRP